MKTIEQTWQYKTKRVFKYILAIFVITILCQVLSGVIHRFTDAEWLDVKDDWKMIYGAMVYRLISTWDYR